MITTAAAMIRILVITISPVTPNRGSLWRCSKGVRVSGFGRPLGSGHTVVGKANSTTQ